MATAGHITLEDFSGGDIGRQRPAPGDLKRYRGLNTWVYPNGAIGPRPPWYVKTFTGLPTTKTLVRFDASRGPTGTWYAWAFSDGTVYSTTGGSTTAALRGTLQNEAASVTAAPVGSNVLPNTVTYVTDTDNTGGRIRYNGNWEPLYAQPAGAAIAAFTEQTVILVNPANGTPFLRFSSPRNPTEWPAENSVFVGSTGAGHGLYIQKDALVIPRTKVGEIFVFTGVLGFNETLRRLDVGVAPAEPQLANGAVISTSLLVYTSGRTVSVFTGAQLLQQPRPDIPIVSGYDTDPHYDHHGQVVGLDDDERFIIVGTIDQIADDKIKKVWMQSYSPTSGWNRHLLPITPFSVSDGALGASSSKDSARAFLVSPVGASGIVAGSTMSDSSTGGTIKVYETFLRQEAPYLPPGKVLSQDVQTLSAVDADSALPVVAEWFSPEVWGKDDEELTVRSVLVDYSYDTDSRITTSLGSAVPNRFDLSVQAVQPSEGTAISESAVVAFVPTAGTTIDGGSTIKRGRKLFQFGDQGAGGGFRLHLADWRGVMIHRITVHYDISEARI